MAKRISGGNFVNGWKVVRKAGEGSIFLISYFKSSSYFSDSFEI